MELEEAAIVSQLGPGEKLTFGARLRFPARRYPLAGGRELIVAVSGIGFANAAALLALTLEHAAIDGVLLLGVCGALTQTLEIGDAVFATRLIQHDSVFSGDNGDEPMAPGQPYVSVAPAERADPVFELASPFVSWLRTAVLPKLRVTEGAIASGSEFAGTRDRKIAIARLTARPIAVEMEATALAIIAARADVPLAVLKTVADRLDAGGGVSSDYNLFSAAAAAVAAGVARNLQELWSGGII